ncbi:hypothetical protein G6O67_006746 [Ophiocordyceps sinensis]|uniref:Uncharacterized protein n=1 Tax=Ophiocordyceps sinensis TaxID=72228 RepID=A0A8H4LXC9_9HYPO|nr:hypothetical protein G6O67_006746 [Ophiocordyceps sinensis]
MGEFKVTLAGLHYKAAGPTKPAAAAHDATPPGSPKPEEPPATSAPATTAPATIAATAPPTASAGPPGPGLMALGIRRSLRIID